jgi:SAM-dependent methyltransferase
MGLPKHSTFLARLLAAHFGSDGPRIGAEVGVWKGRNAAHLLTVFPSLTLYLVDAWRRSNYDASESFDGLASRCQRDFDKARIEAELATRFAGARVRLIVGDCCGAASSVPDASLDYVFADGSHSRRATAAVISAWLPKVRRGGLFAGHDYGYPAPGYEGVQQAVDEFALDRQLDTHVDSTSYVWHWRL